MVTLIQIYFSFHYYSTDIYRPQIILLCCLSATHTHKLNTHKRTSDSFTNVHMYINPFTTVYMPIQIDYSWELECTPMQYHIHYTFKYLLSTTFSIRKAWPHCSTNVIYINSFTTRIVVYILNICQSLPYVYMYMYMYVY